MGFRFAIMVTESVVPLGQLRAPTRGRLCWRTDGISQKGQCRVRSPAIFSGCNKPRFLVRNSAKIFDYSYLFSYRTQGAVTPALRVISRWLKKIMPDDAVNFEQMPCSKRAQPAVSPEERPLWQNLFRLSSPDEAWLQG